MRLRIAGDGGFETTADQTLMRGLAHVNLKFAAECLLGLMAEAFDGGEDFIGGSCPSIGLWIFVVSVDVGADDCFELHR